MVHREVKRELLVVAQRDAHARDDLPRNINSLRCVIFVLLTDRPQPLIGLRRRERLQVDRYPTRPPDLRPHVARHQLREVVSVDDAALLIPAVETLVGVLTFGALQSHSRHPYGLLPRYVDKVIEKPRALKAATNRIRRVQDFLENLQVLGILTDLVPRALVDNAL